ncbi:ribonuclease H-like domain-containing protein [Tanacetum coccineum]
MAPENVSSSADLSIGFGDELYLHPNDVTSAPLICVKLTGTENYNIWSCAMKHVIGSKNKLGFLNDTCKRRMLIFDPLSKQWEESHKGVVSNNTPSKPHATASVSKSFKNKKTVEDLQKKEIMEIGNESGGLYLFNEDSTLNCKTSFDCPNLYVYVVIRPCASITCHPANKSLMPLKPNCTYDTNPQPSPFERTSTSKLSKQGN